VHAQIPGMENWEACQVWGKQAGQMPGRCESQSKRGDLSSWKGELDGRNKPK
jgi:hypothetical protein